MLLILGYITSLVISFMAGTFIAKKRNTDYRKRWIESQRILQNIDLTLPEKTSKNKPITNTPAKFDYHELNDSTRIAIVRERFKDHLPIEDDCKGISNEYCTDEIKILRLHQERTLNHIYISQ